MRYVIVAVVIAGFLIWDSTSNGGQMTDSAVRSLRSLLRMLGI